MKNTISTLRSKISGSWFGIFIRENRKIFNELKSYKKLFKEVLTLEEKKILEEDIKKYKTSDTLFVLGSGTTINDLTDSDWEVVRKNDSIGFNLFLAHPFVPTYHFQEAPVKDSFRGKEMDLLIEIMEARKNEYKNLPFIFRYRRYREFGLKTTDFPEPLRKNIHVLLTLMVNTSSSNIIKIWLYFFKWMNKIKKDKHLWNTVVYHAGSASYVTGFAYQMGYKKIVLLGIELNNQQYYWDTAKEQTPFYEKCRELRRYLQENFTKHVTADKDAMRRNNNNLPVDEFLYIYNDVFLKPEGVKLYVGSVKSALYPHLELYKFNSNSKN